MIHFGLSPARNRLQSGRLVVNSSCDPFQNAYQLGNLKWPKLFFLEGETQPKIRQETNLHLEAVSNRLGWNNHSCLRILEPNHRKYQGFLTLKTSELVVVPVDFHVGEIYITRWFQLLCSSGFGEDLTIISFRWVETTNEMMYHIIIWFTLKRLLPGTGSPVKKTKAETFQVCGQGTVVYLLWLWHIKASYLENLNTSWVSNAVTSLFTHSSIRCPLTSARCRVFSMDCWASNYPPAPLGLVETLLFDKLMG